MAEKRMAPVAGQVYKHFKGTLYKVLAIAVHTESEEKLVVYQSLENETRVFARPLDMFMSDVDRLRYPFVRAKYRFTLVEDAGELRTEEQKTKELETENKESEKPENQNPEAKYPESEKQELTDSENKNLEEKNKESEKQDSANAETEKPEPALDEHETDTEIEESASEESGTESDEVTGAVLNPYVEAVLDEKEYSRKIESFEFLRGKCTEEMLETIAIALDIRLTEGSIDEQYAQILKTLRMHEKYESSRLR